MKHEKRKNCRGIRPAGAALALALLFTTGASAAQADTASCYPQCPAFYTSLVDGLKSVGADASFGSRKEIAAMNGISGYTGSAAQNIRLLSLLKSGALRRVAAAGDSGGPLGANLAKTPYLSQDAKTCKATAVAMAVNVLTGSDACTTAGMGGAYCDSIDGRTYTGSDGLLYAGAYRTDSYVGSAAELDGAIDAALSLGVPLVAAVHSTAGGTKHHWVVVVGKSGSEYLIVDPARGGSGTMSANTATLSARSYAFGLTDYAAPHYGYVTFVKK